MLKLVRFLYMAIIIFEYIVYECLKISSILYLIFPPFCSIPSGKKNSLDKKYLFEKQT